MPGINEMLQALFGRVPQNATQGGVPADQGQFRPQNAPLGPLNSSAVPGRSYASGSPRGESAGYTTSSPGWRQDQVPTVPPPLGVTGATGPGAPTPFPRPDPVVTGATGAAAPRGGPTPEMIANATTTPSALFQPLPNPGAVATTSPSALFQPLTPYSQLPGAHGQPPAPQSVFNPASMGQPPAPQGVVDLPALGSPPAPQAITGAPSGPLPPEIVPAPAARGPGPSSVRPPRVIHPDNPTTGKLAKGKDRAQTPKRPKRGGQYDLRQQGSRRSKK